MKKRLLLILSVFMLTYVISDAVYEKKSVFAANDGEYLLGGQTVGIKLYSKGIIITDFEYGEKNPALSAGLKKGDMILFANGRALSDTDSFVEVLSESTELNLVYDRGGKTMQAHVVPGEDENGRKRVGMWVRDSIGGVGTVTFYDASRRKVAALGHPVTETDTGRSFTVGKGEITQCRIASIEKSSPGAPGELYGVFTENGTVYADITENSQSGLFGNLYSLPSVDAPRVTLARAHEIHDGGAILYSDVSGTNTAYSVKIKKLYSKDNNDFIVEITDSRLLNLTGGIVQGMSGSPIVQGGKLIGAVTHVFVNNPTKGYGIFVENMLAEADSIK